MLKYFLFFVVCCANIRIAAQNTAIGQWQTHQCYKVAKSIVQADNLIYVGTESALFSYDTDNAEIKTYTKVDGFSDLNIKNLSYDPISQQLMILYANNNIDFYKNGKIINFKDLQNADIGTAVIVNTTIIDNSLVYLATNIGIIVIDLQTLEIKDTYIIGENGERIPVYQVAINNDKIAAATPKGLLSADRNTDLWNYANWYFDPQLPPNQVVWHVAYLNNQLYAEIQDNQIYQQQNNGTWTFITGDNNYTIIALRESNGKLLTIQRNDDQGQVAVISSDNTVSLINNFYMPRPIDAITDTEGNYWIADNWIALHLLQNDGYYQNIAPESPRSSAGFRLNYRNNELWVAAGNADHKFDGVGGGLGENFEGVWQFEDGKWQTFNQYSVPTMTNKPNIISTAFDTANPNIIYFGSLDDGLLQFDISQNLITDLTPQLRIIQNFDESREVRIASLKTDIPGNLWMSSILSPAPLMVKKTDGTFKSFKFANIQSGETNRFSEMVIDDYEQVWALQINKGVLVFNPTNDINSNTDINNVSSANYKILTEGEGRGNLPGETYFAIAKDQDGYIWIGTDDGIAVIYCPYNIISEGCDAIRPYVEQDGIGAYLLQNERVTSISIDAANRKWVGTANGLWLFSPDGTKTIHHFTTQNSPLLSNYITHTVINNNDGTIYIATNQGILSYKSDAIKGEAGHSEIVVYPNPIRPNYIGDIAIKGLPQNATVKITDTAGNLAYETQSLGGQAIWNGKDYNGNPVKSGVYLVFSSDPTGVQHQVHKIVIIR